MINGRTKYKDWLSLWLEVYKKPAIKEKSLTNIEVCIRRHMPEKIKNTPIKKLTPLAIQTAIGAIERSRTRIYTYDVYNESLRTAASLGYIKSNPVDLVKAPRHVRKVGEALTHEELKIFLEKIKGRRTEGLFLFFLYTGCRRQEALSLKYEDVDFENKIIHIRGTKTEKSDRIIPLFDQTEEIIRKSDGREFVFNFTKDHVSKEFKSLCPSHKLHDLRHSFATFCIENGISLKVVQKLLGHARLNITAEIYVHALDAFILSEANKYKLPV